MSTLIVEVDTVERALPAGATFHTRQFVLRAQGAAPDGAPLQTVRTPDASASFDIATPGAYTVEVQDLDPAGALLQPAVRGDVTVGGAGAGSTYMATAGLRFTVV